MNTSITCQAPAALEETDTRVPRLIKIPAALAGLASFASIVIATLASAAPERIDVVDTLFLVNAITLALTISALAVTVTGIVVAAPHMLGAKWKKALAVALMPLCLVALWRGYLFGWSEAPTLGDDPSFTAAASHALYAAGAAWFAAAGACVAIGVAWATIHLTCAAFRR